MLRISDIGLVDGEQFGRVLAGILSVLDEHTPALQATAVSAMLLLMAERMQVDPRYILEATGTIIKQNENIPWREQIRAVRAYLQDYL